MFRLLYRVDIPRSSHHGHGEKVEARARGGTETDSPFRKEESSSRKSPPFPGDATRKKKPVRVRAKAPHMPGTLLRLFFAFLGFIAFSRKYATSRGQITNLN